jgi:hypothetical protein
MIAYSVAVTVDHPTPLTGHQVEQLTDLGVTAADIGGRRSTTRMTLDAHRPDLAAGAAIDRVLAVAPGDVAAVEVLTHEELDRQLAEPPFPELLGISEVGEHLGISRQRASALQTRQDFPAPVAVLRSGPVWRKGDLSRFADTWERKPGRPAKITVDAQTVAAIEVIGARDEQARDAVSGAEIKLRARQGEIKVGKVNQGEAVSRRRKVSKTTEG